jgi:hypothetical protein
VAEPDRAAAAPWPTGERDRLLAKLYLHDYGADSIGAALPNPKRSTSDLRRIGTACGRGEPPKLTRLKGAEAVSADTWRRIEARLVARTPVDAEALRRLAEARAQGIRAALVGTLGVSEERVFLRAPALQVASDGGRVASSLELTAD